MQTKSVTDEKVRVYGLHLVLWTAFAIVVLLFADIGLSVQVSDDQYQAPAGNEFCRIDPN